MSDYTDIEKVACTLLRMHTFYQQGAWATEVYSNPDFDAFALELEPIEDESAPAGVVRRANNREKAGIALGIAIIAYRRRGRRNDYTYIPPATSFGMAGSLGAAIVDYHVTMLNIACDDEED